MFGNVDWFTVHQKYGAVGDDPITGTERFSLLRFDPSERTDGVMHRDSGFADLITPGCLIDNKHELVVGGGCDGVQWNIETGLRRLGRQVNGDEIAWPEIPTLDIKEDECH